LHPIDNEPAVGVQRVAAAPYAIADVTTDCHDEIINLRDLDHDVPMQHAPATKGYWDPIEVDHIIDVVSLSILNDDVSYLWRTLIDWEGMVGPIP
jgi:hypothetical protein